tara:strand:+ start:1352 stop:1732 length:381 start_codon:yes stop_codon:yes gene_type:complete
MIPEGYVESKLNRLEHVVSDIIAMEDPDDMMLAVTETLTETELIPEIGKYYTFIYAPKTPRIRYDQFPLIACVGLFRWGFRGMNYHWGGDFRNYTWNEVLGQLHIAYPMEMEDLRSIPYQNFKINI